MNLEAKSERERRALNLFRPILEELGQLSVLLIGLRDEGFLADACAVAGAAVTCIDPDRRAVAEAREASRRRLAQAHGRKAPRPPAIEAALLEEAFERFDPAQFELILSHLEPARLRDLAAFFRTTYRVVHTDGLLALSLPHPCFSPGVSDYFSPAELPGIEGFLQGPIYHRPLSGVIEAAEAAGYEIRGLSEQAEPPDGSGMACLLLKFGKDKWAP